MQFWGGALVALILLGQLTPMRAQAATAEDELGAVEATYRTAGAAAAFPEFERLAQTFRERGEEHGYARALSFLGECQWRLGDYARAADYLDKALALKTKLGDRAEEAKTLNV